MNHHSQFVKRAVTLAAGGVNRGAGGRLAQLSLSTALTPKTKIM